MTAAEQDAPARDAKRGALIAAGGVGAWLLLTALVEKLLGLLSYSLYSNGSSGLYGLDASYWLDLLIRIAVFILPVALGFFLAWRFVMPITADLPIIRVITSSIAATALAAAAYFLAKVVEEFVKFTSFGGPLFGASFPGLDYRGSGPIGLLAQLQGAMSAFFVLLPLGILAGILLHHWLRYGSFSRRGDV